MGDNSRPKG